jgi:N-hydroxyarylamine O-acetyltransferase
MDRRPAALPAYLIERVLEKLCLEQRPEPGLAGLTTLYDAWCRKVPFDNVRKLIQLRSGEPGPLPGDGAADFFEAWLRFGVGGTCWAGNGALQALLASLGFDAQRGLATMLAAPDIPPNHGTVVVSCDGARYIVDASMLHGTPLPLDERAQTGIDHAAWGVSCAPRESSWSIRWRPLHQPDGLECRIERLQVSAQSFLERHEHTRGWSPFNYALYARRNLERSVIGIAFGQSVEIDAAGSVHAAPLAPARRAQWLIEQLGMHQALIEQLPPDLPTPPPPGSASARRATEAGR